ncbi:MAG: TonB-dependent receptor [Prevotellaceae bacterium]|nr:TonB-dependent receptor [Prevotellaceae bacterium]
MRRLLIATFAAMLTWQAIAQENQTKTETLNPVVVTGTGTYRKAAGSPVAVQVISAKDLEDSQSTNLLEALTKLTPSITTHTTGQGTSVNFNGVGDDYILILENGKRISGDDRWSRLSVKNIKRVEIYSGAASALYGSDALAGVINIITEDTKTGVDVQTSSKVRSKGRLEDDINVDISKGKFSSFTSYNHSQADSWQVNHYDEFDENGEKVYKLTGRPMSTGFHSNNITERMEWRFNDQWSIYVRGNMYGNETERDHNASYFKQSSTTDAETGEKTYTYKQTTAYTYDILHKSYMYGGGARYTPNTKTHLYLDVYSDNFSSKYHYWQTAEKESYKETRKRTHYVNETLRGIFRLTDWNKLSAGAEFIQESLSSQSDNIDFETTNTYNLFAQDEVNIAKGFEGVLGLRYTYNNNFGSALTPNIALFYHVKGFRMRASYAGGYRTPTLSQLYATDQAKTNSRYTINNTSLKPEKNNFLNFNLEYSNKWASLSATAFVNRIRDMINYRTMTEEEILGNAHLSEIRDDGWATIRQRDNIDKAKLRGFSANVKFLLPQGITLGAGYTFTNSVAKTKTLNTKTQEYEVTTSPVDKSVRDVFSFIAMWDRTFRSYHLNICVNGHQQGRRYSSTYGYADGYGQWDISTKHTFTLDKFVVEPSVGIENVFNQRDTSPWCSNFSTINPGRSAFVSLALRFKD